MSFCYRCHEKGIKLLDKLAPLERRIALLERQMRTLRIHRERAFNCPKYVAIPVEEVVQLLDDIEACLGPDGEEVE